MAYLSWLSKVKFVSIVPLKERVKVVEMSIVCTEAIVSPCLNLTPTRPGYVWVTIDPKTKNQLPFPNDYEYFSFFLPRVYTRWAVRIKQFKVRPDDVWVLSFPKAGEYFANPWFEVTRSPSIFIKTWNNINLNDNWFQEQRGHQISSISWK